MLARPASSSLCTREALADLSPPDATPLLAVGAVADIAAPHERASGV